LANEHNSEKPPSFKCYRLSNTKTIGEPKTLAEKLDGGVLSRWLWQFHSSKAEEKLKARLEDVVGI
jgi:hypothetical protein